MSVRAQRRGLTYPHQASIDLEKAQPSDKEPFKIIRHIGRPTEWTEERIEAEAEALYQWLENPKNYYFNKFMVSRGLHPEHATRFSERSPLFRDACKLARVLQEVRLVDLAVSKAGDGAFIKFMLCAKEGWKDQTTVNHNLNPLASLLDKIALEAQDPIVIEPVDPIEP